MVEGLSSNEILDSSDALRRRGNGWQSQLKPPWETLSGFASSTMLAVALARSWPAFPLTGNFVALRKILDWNAPIVPMRSVTRAIPSDELSFY
jgi:hypothetical protein